MDVLDLARLQFASTTLFHFVFVPLSIGLAAWVAICQTAAYRTGKDEWEQAARFWGKLFLVSFALGVATGIVQEFQFGMNWSGYSRYVGDVFGAPLAMEALIAFFLESTFLGLWIFGRGRLSPKLHLATIWAVAIGSMLSAYFILAANAWMQHPVGYEINEATGRAEMTSILEVLTNTTALLAFPHTILGAWATAGMVVAAVAAWHLRRGTQAVAMGRTLRIALAVTLAATALTGVVGHFQGMHLVDEQPMKMAAAEALFETKEPAPFSLFATGDWTPNPGRTNVDVQVPRALSFLAQGNFDAKVLGINELNARYRAQYGPGEYAPIVGLTYWSFRIMVGLAMVMMALSAWLLWRSRRSMAALGPRWLKVLVPAAALPFLANFAGWIFTEMGRQPWVVQGLLKTEDAISPSTSATEVGLTLVGFTAVYTVFGLIGYRLFARLARKGPDPLPDGPPQRPAGTSSDDLVLAY
ncbi:cytochrome ubiquinol oxidase subunit I [Conexibacter sp. SYSU D00693]|uniref:cytochrome ubiquinol oxidase subunit I n=1 Tax=Conexibacter sp. SYSU D00693 TaxID=2812560 RepID=UPI00196B7E06|nr:cytochrome ubiquinol oxidase subunit I [Conexibacter sp. SYSU D00693]